jgi:hypothetical protein
VTDWTDDELRAMNDAVRERLDEDESFACLCARCGEPIDPAYWQWRGRRPGDSPWNKLCELCEHEESLS